MVIGKLNVLLGLNSAQFQTGMQRAGNGVRTFRQQVTASTSTVATIAPPRPVRGSLRSWNGSNHG